MRPYALTKPTRQALAAVDAAVRVDPPALILDLPCACGHTLNWHGWAALACYAPGGCDCTRLRIDDRDLTDNARAILARYPDA